MIIPMRYDELMRRIGMSDADLAAKLFVGRMTAYRWNRCKKTPTRHMQRALAKLAGLKPDEVDWESKGTGK